MSGGAAQRPALERRLLGVTALALPLTLAAFALASLSTLERGRAELTRSDAAFDRGDVELAMHHARRAARAYVPGARHVALAYERLAAIALGAERAQDPSLALAAWQAARAAALETAHWWQPHVEELERAELNLARMTGSRGAREGEGGLARAARASARAVVLGSLGAVLAVLAAVLRGVAPSGRLQLERLRLPFALFALAVVGSVLSLVVG